MADFHRETDSQKDLALINVAGLLTADDISHAINNFRKNPTRLALWDVTHCQLNELSAADIEKATKLISHNLPEGKTAFVIEKDNFSLGVLFEGFSKIENLPREYRSFTSQDEAMRWLKEGG